MTKKKQDSKADDIKELGFEESIEELTQIVSKIEQGEIELQDSLKQYERGMLLIKHCQEILDEAEKRIEKISGEGIEQEDQSSADEEAE